MRSASAEGGIGIHFRAALAGLALCVGTLVPLGAAPGVACAGEQGRAALVVDTGSEVMRYCVALNEEAVSGLELIVLAGRQHGLDYSLGFGGAAVCMLAGVGPAGDDCWEQYPNFWGYWRGDGSGGWSWSGSGAGSTSVSNGDVEGWTWGSGDDGGSHPAPPPTRFEGVCRPLPKPSPPPKEPGTPRTPPEGEAIVGPDESPAPAAAQSESRPTARHRSRRPARRDQKTPPVTLVARQPDNPDPSVTSRLPAAPVAAKAASEGGPPAAGLGALMAAALLAAGAILRVRTKVND